MAPRDTIERVLDVLHRADSLFTVPEAPTADTVDKATGAAEASDALTGHTGEMTGAIVDAHRELLSSVAQRLSDCADSDARLLEELGKAADSHARSATRAGEVVHQTADACEGLDEWSEIPAAQIVQLLMLRRAMVEMQQLMTQQAGEATRTAEHITTLAYE